MTSPAVLLVLEERPQLEIYGNVLCDKGYDTLTCSSPCEGTHFLEAKNVSLVIVSQGTPSFEGRPVLERSVQLQPAIPVLVVARIVSMHCYLEAMDLGAFDYFELPEPQKLAQVVDIQMLRSALAGTVEWDRLLPILKSCSQDRNEKSREGRSPPSLPRWGPPKFPGSRFSLSRPELSSPFSKGSLRDGNERAVWQEHRAGRWQAEHRTWRQRGGYRGYRIPEEHFRGHFGEHHRFRINRLPLVIVSGYPSFQYDGFWFSVVDPWPEYWPRDWYETVMRASPGQGLNSLEAESVSLVVVSQDSPEFEGRVVLERSIRLHPEVPVLVVARVLDIHCYFDAMDLGAADYLESPEPQDLAWVVDTQIHRCAVA